MPEALAHIRVIDLGTVIAMPYCTMFLADLGAEVIKIEEPSAALLRVSLTPGSVPVSQYRDRNKKSLTLNLKHPKGVAILKELVKKADVITENFSVGTMERLGISYAVLKELNPKIIYASISAFGQYGPYASQRGYDILAQAMSGYMSLTGFPNDPPTKSGQSISDYLAGSLCAVAILAAIHHREKTGQGQTVDIALFDSLLATLDGHIEAFMMTHTLPERKGNLSIRNGPLEGVYEAKNGSIALDLTHSRDREKFCQMIGKQEWLHDPDLIRSGIEEWVGTRTKEEILGILGRVGIPVAAVNRVDEMVQDRDVNNRGMFVAIDHPIYGEVKITGSSLKLSETPGRVETLAPLAGEHTREVLKSVLGYRDEEVAELNREGVI
ncbi:MAG: CoA transferase [Candidatus Tectomicrobia bacterium]|nr:CoA transferase [Candidatus Tectomicrobia bacterium]